MSAGVHKDRLKHLAAQFAYKDKAKVEALTHYGPSGQLCCSWENCHVSDVDMLTLDHVNNDGASDRKARGLANIYPELRAEGYPTGFQTLCANHQLKKEIQRRRNMRKA